tara:strand:+ start:71 stop:616 length:546 start_codon:yes stop_codon:yes gene_type:complete
MNRFFLIVLILIFSSVSLIAAEHKEKDKSRVIAQKQLKVATVDFQRVLRESKMGRQYLTSAKTNIEKKQVLLSKLRDQFNSKRDSYNEQKLVMDEKSRDEQEEELAYKAAELRRKSEDFETEVKIADSRFQRDIMRSLMKEVKIVAEQLGYDLVFSKTSPGLMFFNPDLDITDKVLERMNR